MYIFLRECKFICYTCLWCLFVMHFQPESCGFFCVFLLLYFFSLNMYVYKKVDRIFSVHFGCFRFQRTVYYVRGIYKPNYPLTIWGFKERCLARVHKHILKREKITLLHNSIAHSYTHTHTRAQKSDFFKSK